MGAAIDFPTYLRAVRRARGLSAAALSAKTGLDSGTIYRLERGEARPQMETLRTLAAGLDIDPQDFLTAAGFMTPAELGRELHIPRPDPIQAIHDAPESMFDDEAKELIIGMMERLRGRRPPRHLKRAK